MTEQKRNLDIGELFNLVSTSRWTLINSGLVMMLLGVLYLIVAPPQYQADALLQVDDKNRSVTVLSETSEVIEDRIVISDKVEILKSRSVLGTAIDKLNLDIVSSPIYFPIIGKLFSKWNLLDIGSYAVGNEKLVIDSFSVPEAYLNKDFTLIAKGENRFALVDPDDRLVVEGRVGEPLEVSIDKGHISIAIDALSASEGKRFRLKKLPRLNAIGALISDMKIEESKGTQGIGPKVGLIKVTMTGPDATKTATILNTIVDAFLAQNVQQKFSNADSTLEYLEKQLHDVELELEGAESALNNFRLQQGSVDLSKETLSLLDRAVDIESEISELEREKDELLQLFTPSHSRIAAIDAKLKTLQMELGKQKEQVRLLPKVQQEMLTLSRDVEVTRSLYTLLLNKYQELKVVKAGTVGDITVIDYAIPPIVPEAPKPNLVLMLSLMLGVLFGIAKLLLKEAINAGISDPDTIEGSLGVNVFAVVPNSANQKKLLARSGKRGNSGSVLAATVSDDTAIESLRNLRTVLDYSGRRAKNNIVLITGPTAGVGKSFVAANLGVLWANAGKRILLIDADFRRGNVHHHFGVDRNAGLSNFIMEESSLKDFISKTRVENLYVMGAGSSPNKPTDLLLDSRVDQLLRFCSDSFDYIIVDAPPVLGLSDASILAQKAGITLLVIKESQTTMREVRQAIKSLNQTGVTPDGIVFNNMHVSKNIYGYGKHYGYTYKSALK